MSRHYDVCFKLINSGEFTPEEALTEAALPWCPEDSAQLLITWAWEKQDAQARSLRAAHAAEIRTADLMLRTVRSYKLFEALKASRAASALSTEEPF